MLVPFLRLKKCWPARIIDCSLNSVMWYSLIDKAMWHTPLPYAGGDISALFATHEWQHRTPGCPQSRLSVVIKQILHLLLHRYLSWMIYSHLSFERWTAIVSLFWTIHNVIMLECIKILVGFLCLCIFFAIQSSRFIGQPLFWCLWKISNCCNNLLLL